MLLRQVTQKDWKAYEPAAAPPEVDLAAKATDAAKSETKLARRESFLTADGQTATALEREALLGTNDLVEWNFLDRCMCVSRPVGRIVVPRPNGTLRATGFLIAPGVLLTNHHVLNDAGWAAMATIEFGYRYNIAGEIGQVEIFDLAPVSFFVADEALDFAAVAVAPRSRTGARIEDFSFLRLHAETGKLTQGDFVTILQHPDGEPMQIALRENKVTEVDPDKPVIWYHADTAHGSSGAPVLNDSFQLVALHSSGRIRRDANGNFALRSGKFVASVDGLKDSDVVWEDNVGVRVSRLAPAIRARAAANFPPYAALLDQAMTGGDVLADAIEAARTQARTPPTLDTPREREARTGTPGARLTTPRDVIVPLQLRVSLESPGAGAGAGANTMRSSLGDMLEAFKMQIPVIYDDLPHRKGYDPHFLQLGGNRRIALPRLTPAGKQVAAKLIGKSSYELKYHKFSVFMHKDRRLALFTAANVDWSEDAKEIDGEKPTRKELTGITDDHTIEQWVLDERIAAEHQLPDRFYNDDGKAFDKGHLVRREDVCWGRTFEDIQKANGDTYHVTNCTPQTEPFNRSGSGDENWGDFENEVGKQSKKERLILFSGPVLDPKDRWFRGLDDNGGIRIQVPRRFWKVVVAKGMNGPEAFGFVLEQDVIAITEKEFVVSPTWKAHKKKISTIAGYLRGWVDFSALEAIEKQ
ncbi:MAG TPA: DNA/RNA non-specific endonuclease [Steroidobacteraceae bacterium]|jgi:endonuclease G|nr:DNA/RNA non-specific endonuclease [Steroidobacteraceae bacterium]